MSQQELLRFLECHTCFEIMFSPIYICSAGHSICNECKLKVNHCPTCRGLFSLRRRNRTLEDLSATVLHPCPHKGNGCTELTKYFDLNNHANSCCFRPYACIVQGCEFKGPRHAYMKHVEEEHAEKTSKGGHTEHTCQRIERTFGTKISFVLYHEVVFLVTQHQVNPGTLYWICQFVGKSEDAANFIFTITVDDGAGRKYSFTDRCQPDISILKNVMKSGHCLAIPITVLRSFMDQEQRIPYTVDIKHISDYKA